MKFKTIPDVDDGFGDFIPACREYILLRLDLNSRVFAAVPGGTVIGPLQVALLPVELHSVSPSRLSSKVFATLSETTLMPASAARVSRHRGAATCRTKQDWANFLHLGVLALCQLTLRN